ncbi:MAG: hypothetical protein AB8B87_16985 [Granulosicoccus sp.]
MSILQTLSRTIRYLVLPGALLATNNAAANNSTFELKLSLGGVWQSSNDIQIPNDNEGTRFSLNEVTGSGPWPGVRLEGIWNVRDRHAIRVLLAPLNFSEVGIITEPVLFAGGTFSMDQAVTGEYRFNSWRLGYRYHLRAHDNWDLWIGGTLKVRDAEIKLTQNGASSSDDNVGFVPLLHLAGEYRFNSPLSISADLDGLAGGPGRAIDLGIGLNYQTTDTLRLGVEVRTLEGGADTDDVYNFAWFNSFLVTARYSL